MLAITLIERAQSMLVDVSGRRWSKADLLSYLNSGISQVILHRPDAFAEVMNLVCVADSRQTLPANALRLLDVNRNKDSSAPIVRTERDYMDNNIPRWHTVAADPDIEFYIYDERYPKQVYLYPKPALGHEIEIVASTVPDPIVITDFDASAEVIPIDDIYQNPLLDWMLYRAYAKDTAAASLQRSQAHFQAFFGALGAKNQVDTTLSPGAN